MIKNWLYWYKFLYFVNFDFFSYMWGVCIVSFVDSCIFGFVLNGRDKWCYIISLMFIRNNKI